ncbi:uncharacterized protein METZ01_LOCUS355340, partial [marine metagenome]
HLRHQSAVRFHQRAEAADRPAVARQAVWREQVAADRPRLRTGHAVAQGKGRAL